MQIVFLGTGSSTPTEDRWLPSVLLSVKGESLLLDCGEGTQYRVLTAGLKVNKLAAILVTHMHGDHLYGLPGLLESLEVWGRREPLRVFGPSGIDEYLNAALARRELAYTVTAESVAPGLVMTRPGYRVYAVHVDHGVEAYAYIVVEDDYPGKFDEVKAKELGIPPGPLRRKLLLGEPVTLPDGRVVEPREVVGPSRRGLKVVYSGDTRPCDDLIQAAKGADLLIHEATFSSDLEEEAKLSFHSTASGAAKAASQACAKLLVLTHFSGRYRSVSPLLEEARTVFWRSYAAKDMLKVELKRWGESWLVAQFEPLGTGARDRRRGEAP